MFSQCESYLNHVFNQLYKSANDKNWNTFIFSKKKKCFDLFSLERTVTIFFHWKERLNGWSKKESIFIEWKNGFDLFFTKKNGYDLFSLERTVERLKQKKNQSLSNERTVTIFLSLKRTVSIFLSLKRTVTIFFSLEERLRSFFHWKERLRSFFIKKDGWTVEAKKNQSLSTERMNSNFFHWKERLRSLIRS